MNRLTLEIERLRRRNLIRLHPLRQLFWECTLRCNVSCRHCGSDCRSVSASPDMPAEDFLHVLDSEVSPHFIGKTKPMIVISGGEPLMRKDLVEIGHSLQERGYSWGFVTNGLALTEILFGNLLQAGLSSVSISLDGLEKDHVWLRQHPLAFEGACRAIRLAAKTPNLAWDVVTCVTPNTLNKLSDIRSLLIQLGCHHWRLFAIDPMGRAASDASLLLSPEQHRYLLDFIAEQRELTHNDIEVSYSCEGFLGDYEGRVRNHLFHCAAGVSVASILIDGSISACTSIRGKYYQGNIYHDSFWKIWENGFLSYRDRSWMRKMAPCKDCKVFRYCEGNGMHLRREDGTLIRCVYNEIGY